MHSKCGCCNTEFIKMWCGSTYIKLFGLQRDNIGVRGDELLGRRTSEDGAGGLFSILLSLSYYDIY